MIYSIKGSYNFNEKNNKINGFINIDIENNIYGNIIDIENKLFYLIYGKVSKEEDNITLEFQAKDIADKRNEIKCKLEKTISRNNDLFGEYNGTLFKENNLEAKCNLVLELIN